MKNCANNPISMMQELKLSQNSDEEMCYAKT